MRPPRITGEKLPPAGRLAILGLQRVTASGSKEKHELRRPFTPYREV